jgi:2',3'-cyclic-nucleotide 2'-phosphodiesterase (5'-nucleotidase family)
MLKPYVIREVGGRRVALVGVTGGGAGSYGAVKPATAPADALRAILPEVRSKADVVVVLADLEAPDASALADGGLGMDVLLGARSVSRRAPTRIGGTIVANAGGLGRFVDKLTLTFGPDGQIASFDQTEVAVDDSVSDDPGIRQLQADYKG